MKLSGDLAIRPLLTRLAARLAALGLLVALCAEPVSSAFEAATAIDAARLRLDRARALTARPPAAAPLVAADGAALLAAFRGRLEALAGAHAVVIDGALLEADPARPDLPRLRGTLRGTAEGLHGLMHALETGTPVIAAEDADLDVARPADAEIGRPTVMRLALTVRGVIAAPPPAPRRTP